MLTNGTRFPLGKGGVNLKKTFVTIMAVALLAAPAMAKSSAHHHVAAAKAHHAHSMHKTAAKKSMHKASAMKKKTTMKKHA